MQLGFNNCFPQSGRKELKHQASVPWQMVFERFLTMLAVVRPECYMAQRGPISGWVATGIWSCTVSLSASTAQNKRPLRAWPLSFMAFAKQHASRVPRWRADASALPVANRLSGHLQPLLRCKSKTPCLVLVVVLVLVVLVLVLVLVLVVVVVVVVVVVLVVVVVVPSALLEPRGHLLAYILSFAFCFASCSSWLFVLVFLLSDCFPCFLLIIMTFDVAEGIPTFYSVFCRWPRWFFVHSGQQVNCFRFVCVSQCAISFLSTVFGWSDASSARFAMFREALALGVWG